MARIKIGNIKGPKGDTGARGATGPTGPAGPQGPLPPLTNNFLATVAGKSALDAAAGKVLKDQLDQQNSDLTLRNITEGNFAKNDVITYVIAYQFGSMVIVTFTVAAGLSGWVETVLTSKITPIADVTCTRGRSAGVNDNNINMQATLKADGKIYFHFESATTYAQSFSAAYFTTK